MKTALIIQQYLMCRALLSIASWYILLQEQINVFHSSTDKFSVSPFKLFHSSSTILGFFFFGISFSNFQIFPNLFVFELWTAHNINILLRKKCLNRYGALSCINTANWLITVLKLGTCFLTISLYTFALILPRSLGRGPLPVAETISDTITFSPPNLTVLLVHWAEYHSLGLHWKNLLSSQLKKVKLWLIAERNTIPLFFSQYDVFSGKFQSVHFVFEM